MANADAMPPRRFCWEISEPFLPVRCLAARFYTGTMKWRVTLSPIDILFRYWRFTLNLACEESGEDFFVNRVKIDVSLDGREVVTGDQQDYRFSNRNHHSYSFEVEATPHPRELAHQLKIEVEITSRASFAALRPGNGLPCSFEDLQALSESMGGLVFSSEFSDLELEVQNSTDRIKAHYCILDARWGTFVRQECLNAPPNDVVPTDISRDVLIYILRYMYSGMLNRNELVWWDLALRAELFQVIDQYRIYHLYNCFATRGLSQERKILKDVCRHLMNLPLGPDRQVNDHCCYRLVAYKHHDFIFRIWFVMTEGEPRFSYDLNLKSGPKCHAQVNVELVRLIKYHGSDSTSDASWDVHHCNHDVEPGDPRGSNNCPFVDHEKGRARFTFDNEQYNYFIRCILSLTDGNESAVVNTEVGSQWATERERFEVLSDHLYTLQQNKTRANMKILCHNGVKHPVHKAILAARVPEWERVLSYSSGHQIVYYRTAVSDEALRYVLEYMYTGKTFRIPDHCRYEIAQFARTGEFFALERLVS